MNKKVRSPLPTLVFIAFGLIGLILIVLLCAGCGQNRSEEPESATLVAKTLSSYELPISIVEYERESKLKEAEKATKEEETEPETETEVEIVYEEIVEETLPYSYTEEYDTYEEYYYNYSDGNVLNPSIGVVYYNGHKETYYSQRVLPGDGLDIPGRHVAGDGTIRDGDGYICVAADPSYLPYGSLVETSLGAGKVYDSGCDYGTIDIYTDW